MATLLKTKSGAKPRRSTTVNQKIRFEFEGKTYEADMAFYDVNRCTLPDGRLLMANG